ncbi:hypothetical protein CPB84DRAFT_1794480 [Gymnopilus junonius]|uniref:Uncharacterized protein n=1 Tax=Gymnopilus junonius TaxID=109634 RepID=A0A9P5TI67_GYMJU|nr:hypothetical protein CPB84DRAFT_1794480 [Gymnopilus junonius]
MLEIGYGHTPNVHFFLSHLIVPKQATRCIYSEQLDEFSAFLDVAIDGPYAHIRRIAITGQRSYEQMFGIKDTTLFIHGKVDFVQIRSLFSEAILPNVQELVLSPLPEHMPTSVELRHMLRSLPLLTTLTMAGAASIHLHRLTSALGVLNDAQNNATNVINPNLRVIRVFNYSISQFYPDSYLDIFPLVLLSQARAGIGHPLQKLEIEDCQQGQVEELQGYLGATELMSHKKPFGKQVFGRLLDEMWSAIRDSVPVLH